MQTMQTTLLVHALTTSAMNDTSVARKCSTLVHTQLVAAMKAEAGPGPVADDVMKASIHFISKLAARNLARWWWLDQQSRRYASTAQGAMLAMLGAEGAHEHTSYLQVLREIMTSIMNYSTTVDDCKELSKWVIQPGFIPVLEMLTRGEHGPQRLPEIIESASTCSLAILSTIHAMVASAAAAQPATQFMAILGNCVNLAGTLRKQVGRAGQAPFPQWDDHQYALASDVHATLCETTNALLEMHRAGSDRGEAHKQHLALIERIAFILHLSIQGLLALLLRVRGPCPEFHRTVRAYDMFNISAMDLPAVKARLGLALHGRVLPGCCNYACSNLSGFSEAGVKTLLCSGCRRSRYCSVKCQKEDFDAWHGSVCGRGSLLA